VVEARAELTTFDEIAEPDEESAPRPSVLVGYGPSRAKVARRPRRPKAVAAPPNRLDAVDQRAYATPLVRKLARELGIELQSVTASGAYGQITRADLTRVAAADRYDGPASSAPAETRTPIRGVRKQTAEAMVSSAFSAPHVTEWVTADVTRTLKLLERMRAERAFAGSGCHRSC